MAISGTMPRTYIKWLEAAKKFYSVASADTAVQGKLSHLKISVDDLTAANTLISELETARAVYLKEKGESQDATKGKDAAFAKIDDWMSEFYAVAKIGLEDNPQLLEQQNHKRIVELFSLFSIGKPHEPTHTKLAKELTKPYPFKGGFRGTSLKKTK